METRYYFDGRHYMKLDVEYDDWMENPREAWDHDATMVIGHTDWYRYETIVNESEYKDGEDVLHRLVSDEISDKTLINYIKRGKTHLSVSYDRSKREWNLYDRDNCIDYTDQTLDWLIDSIIYELTDRECADLLEKYADLEIMPLEFVDYGSNGQRLYEKSDYDRSNSVAYISKKEVAACMLTEKNWRENARQIISQEVKELDLYCQGACYYAVWSMYDFESRTWTEYDSCGGFLTDEYGDALFQEIAETTATMHKEFMDLFKAVRAA